jgi:AcrR family transcriptional regulator
MFTVQALLDAATRVLQEGSLAQFNTNRVAEVAGVSVGSIYQYFPSKDALIARLIEQEQTRLLLAVQQAQASGSHDLPSALRALVQVAVAHQWNNPVFAAVLDAEEQRLPLREPLREFQERIVLAVAQFLEGCLPGRAQANYEAAAKDCVVVCKALVEAEGEKPQGDAFENRLVDVLAAIVAKRCVI